MKKYKNIRSVPTEWEKLRYMRTLEENNMNKSLTARQLGISRSTMIRYHKRYWDQYIAKKKAVVEDSLEVGAKKMLLAVDAENIRIKLTDVVMHVLDHMDELMENDPDSLSLDLATQYLGALLPYVAEKRSAVGAKEPMRSPEEKHTAFVQNIMTKIDLHQNDKNS